MDAKALQLVSVALNDRIEHALKLESIAGDVYVGPLDDKNAQNAAVVLFLYRVAVNSDLRSSTHVVQPPDDAEVVHEGSLPLDLYYLLTVGPAKENSEEAELESLHTLGCAMRALNDDPILVGLPVHGEPVRVTLDPIGSEEMSRIWTLFPTANYRTSVVYLATPVWIDPAVPRVQGPPVTYDRQDSGHLRRTA